MAKGDIGAIIDTGIFAGRGSMPSIIHIAGDVYAIAYQGPDLDGWLCTVTIDNLGNIGAVIDTLEFDPVSCYSPHLIHVSGNIYAIAYWFQAGDDGIVKTVSIDSAGNIGAIIDSFTFDAVRGRTPSIIHIAGDVYAIAYQGPDDDGWLCTVTIDNLGNIAATGSTLEFDAVYCAMPHIIHVSGDIYAIAYTRNDLGWVCTVSIDNLGNIGAVIDSFRYDDTWSNDQRIIHVAGDVFAIAYTFFIGTNIGKVCTVTIDNLGNIGAVPGDGLPTFNRYFDAIGVRPDIIHIVANVYAIAYKGPGDDGWLKTFTINDDGSIPGNVYVTPIDTLEFDDTSCDYPRLIHVGGGVYAVAYLYQVGLWPGYMKTFDIESIVAPTVTTDPATLITAATATLNGTLDDDGGEACDCGFEWGETITYGNTTPTQSRTTGQTFSQGITGLDPNKTYHFRAFATNSVGISYGADRTFTTLVGLPTVTTDPATLVTANSATLNGTLDDDGGEACDCGFEWGETILYGNTTPTQSRTTGQTFSQAIAGLDPNKTYHFRAFATNSAGTSYGADRTFKTLIALPTVTTNPATGIGMILAVLNGTLDNDGGEICACGFEWGTDITYGITTPTESKVIGETFAQLIRGLFPGTVYHFRAFATNSAGTSYGADRTFTTLTTEMIMSKAYALARREL